MRSANTTPATILGLVASGLLFAGCANEPLGTSGDESLLSQNGSAMPASLESSTGRVPPSIPLDETFGPVDPAVAASAWKSGVTGFENGDYTGAVKDLRLAVAGSPDDAYRRYLLGLALWKSGDLPGAEDALVESVKRDGSRLKTWVNLARVRNERGDRTGALDAAEKGLDLDPTSADVLHQKGRALMELGRGPEALDALQTAHDLDVDNGYIANSLGLLLIQLGRPGDAVPTLEIAKTRLPHVAYVRNNLGVAYERTGKTDEAKVEYQAAVEAGDMGGKAMKSLVRLGATDTTETSIVTAAAEPQIHE
jgi:Flp pilus assembly protein TadD